MGLKAVTTFEKLGPASNILDICFDFLVPRFDMFTVACIFTTHTGAYTEGIYTLIEWVPFLLGSPVRPLPLGLDEP